MQVRVEGLAELKRALAAVDAAAPKELARMNHRAGEIVATEARRLAPKGAHLGGGSITPISESIRSATQASSVVVMAGGAKSPHVQAIEFGGTIPRFHSRRKTRVRKRSFIYAALENKLGQLEKEYLAMLDGVLALFSK